MLILNGDADVIIDRNGDGTAWRETRSSVAKTAEVIVPIPLIKLPWNGYTDIWEHRGGASRRSGIFQQLTPGFGVTPIM